MRAGMNEKENFDIAFHLTIIGFFLLAIFSGCSASYFLTDNGQSNINRPQRYNITKKDLAQFTSTIRPHKQNPDSLYIQARYFQRIEKHKLALSALEELILIDSTNFKAYNALGISYDHLGDHLWAVKAYKRALRLSPDQAYLHNNLGYCYLLQANIDAAINSFAKAIELDRKIAKYHNNLALAYAKKGLYDLAFIEFEIAGNESKARCNVNKMYQQNYHYQEIKSHFVKTSKLNLKDTGKVQVSQSTSVYAKINMNADKSESGTDSELQIPSNIEIDGKGRRIFHSKIHYSASQNTEIEESKMKPVGIQSHKKLKMNPSNKGFETGDARQKFEIEISNGNGVNRMAQRVGNYLNSKGFNVGRLTNAKHFNFDETKIYYLDEYFHDAFEVAKQIPGYQHMEEVQEFEKQNIKIKMLIGKDIVFYDKFFHLSDRDRES